MDLIIEMFIELILEGSFDASKNKKVPRPIRYMLIVLISLLYIFIIGVLFFAGFGVINDNFLIGSFLIAMGLVFLILSLAKFRSTYSDFILHREDGSGNL